VHGNGELFQWFIPRNVIIGTLLAMNPFGIPCFIDQIAESALRAYHYGADLKWMSPAAYNGKPADRLYSKTPIVNGEFLKLVRENRADYVRAKVSYVYQSKYSCQNIYFVFFSSYFII
jgi:hypothetical protein